MRFSHVQTSVFAFASACAIFAGCAAEDQSAAEPVASGTLMVAIAHDDVSYGLKLADGTFVDLNLDHAQQTTWSGSNEVIDWSTAGGSPVEVFGTMGANGIIDVVMMRPPTDPVQMESAISAAGQFRMLTIPVTFNGGPTVGTPEQLRSTLDVVKQRLEEGAFGRDKLSVSYDIANPVNIQFTGCHNQFYNWLTVAKEGAKSQGFDVSQYNTFAMVGDPPYDREKEPSCGWAGLGSMGGQGIISKVLNPLVFVHELGHNFALPHASAERCTENGQQVTMSARANCSHDEYGDRFNAMGISDHHFGAQYKAQIGWIPSSRILTPQGNQDITLAPMTAPSTGIQLLRIPGPEGNMYTVEFIQPSPTNPIPSSHPSVNGVTVRVHYGNDLGRARLLDMTPGGTRVDFDDAALGVGKSHTFYGTDTTLTVLSVGPDGARVRIASAGGGGDDGGGGSTDPGDGGGDAGEGESLVSASSSKCVSVQGSSLQSGAAIVQLPCSGSDGQSWKFESIGTDRYVVKDVNSGMCLDVRGGTSREREPIQQSTCNGARSQQWKSVDMGGGKISLRNGNSGKCLDTLSGTTADGARYIQYTCKGFTSQRFERR